MGHSIKELQSQFTKWETVHDISQMVACETFRSGQEVHVWRVKLNNNYLNHSLSSEEKEKASRFRFSRDQNRYTGSHVILRHLLGAYMNCDPYSIIFNQGKYGKPYIEGEQSLKFNMTYTTDTACYVVAMENDVGIDIEYIDLDFDWLDIVRLYFSSKEFEDLQHLPLQKQSEAFFYLWTQKEAMLKAEGIGLKGVDSFADDTFNTMTNRYDLLPFNDEEGCQGAIAIASKMLNIRFLSISNY